MQIEYAIELHRKLVLLNLFMLVDVIVAVAVGIIDSKFSLCQNAPIVTT